jgi:predicted nucleotidyltransferase
MQTGVVFPLAIGKMKQGPLSPRGESQSEGAERSKFRDQEAEFQLRIQRVRSRLTMFLYEEIFREFQKQKVKYVLVGGIAVNLLGGMRSTADLDILVEMSDDNLGKIVEILTSQGYRVKQPVDPMKISDTRTRQDWIKKRHMKAFNFCKEGELKEVDIVIESPVSFEEAKKSALRIKVDDLTLPVISMDNLIKMKKKTGRTIDDLDIEELNKIKKLKGSL